MHSCFQPLALSVALVIHVIEKSVGGEVGWTGRKRARKEGGKAGLSTRPDNGDHRKLLRRIFHDVAQEPWHKSPTVHTPLIPHKQGHPHPVSPQQKKQKSNVVSTVSISVL